MNLRIMLAAAASLAILGAAATSQAADRATKPEAVAMVGKAMQHLKAAGPDKAFVDFTDKSGKFVDRDLYIVVYDMNGRCLAHGANAANVGKEMIEAKDVDGTLYVKERVELAKAKPSFWQNYKFVDPVSKAVEPKEMYCETAAPNIVCGGVYKQ